MADWITQFIENHGYLGIAALMLAENVFPPLPSELIMPFAAFQAAQGQLHWMGVILAGILGCVLGTLPWYFLGRRLGLERTLRFAGRHGRWLTLEPDQVREADAFLDRHGPWVLVAGRVVPALRTVISLPAGISGMGVGSFCLWTAVGAALWCSVLTGAGLLLAERYDRIAHWMDPVSTGILVALVAWYLCRVIRWRR